MKRKIFKSLLMLVIALAVVLNFADFKTASANTGTMTLEQKIVEFTDNDTVVGYENLKIKVNEYPDKLFKKIPNNFDPSNDKVTINGDNPIVGIIPRELFMQECKKFYLGQEYGFYIYTFKEPYKYGTSDESIYANNGNMHSLVMVFDLIYTTNDILNILVEEFSIKIQPLFQYEFKYLKKNDKNKTGIPLYINKNPITSLNLLKESYDVALNYTFANNLNDAVIASPCHVDNNNYLEREQNFFYLKDFQIATNLENTRTQNRLDTGYNAYNDKGSFFINTAIGGFGKQLKANTILNLNDAFAGVGLIMSLIGCAVDPTGLAFTSLALTIGNMITSSFLNPYVDGDNMVVSETHNTTAANQIAAYQKLIKTSYMKLSTDSEGKNLGYTEQDHYAVAKYKLNNSTGSETPIETLIRSIIGLKISGLYFPECDAELETTWTQKINESNVNENNVSLGTQKLYVLCNYNNDYIFYNSENRYLDFSITNGLTYEIYDQDGNIKNKNSLFEAGKTYKIKIINKTRNTFTNFSISSKNFNISDNKNTEIVLPSGYSTIKFSGVGIFNANLIGNAKIALIDIHGNAVNYNRLNATNADFHVNGNIYITLYNPTSSNVSISLKFTTVKDTVGLGNSTLNPQSINNFKFYKLNLDYTKSYYFNLTYSTGMSTSFVFYDSSFKQIQPASGTMTSTTSASFAFNHTQGIVYMGISGNIGSHALNVKPIGESGEWYINNKKASEYTKINGNIVLKRGFGSSNAIYSISFKLLNGQALTDFYLTDIKNSFTYLNPSKQLVLTNKATINDDFYINLRNHNINLSLIAEHEGIGTITLTKNSSSKILVKLENINEVSRLVYKIGDDQYTVLPSNTDGKLDYSFIISLSENYYKTNPDVTILFSTFISNNLNYNLNMSKSIRLIFAGGGGSVLDRLKISTQQDLDAIRYYSQFHFELRNDIYLTGNWTPIPEFKGSLNGNNYSIHNMNINIDNTPAIHYGLFGLLPSNSKINIIQKVHLKNVNIYGSSKHNLNFIFVGGLVGTNFGQINLCSVTGKIEVHRNNSAVGGIVGRNESTLTNSTFGNNSSARSVLKGNGDIGGIAGQTTFRMSSDKVYNTDLDLYIVEANRSMGGIVGISYNSRISSCVVDNIFMKCSNGYGTTGIYPKMGYIAGTMENGSIYKVGGVNLSHHTTNIASPYKVDTFNGPWGVYGKYIGTINIT